MPRAKDNAEAPRRSGHVAAATGGKRVVTAARKEQNRQAQKAYRLRVKTSRQNAASHSKPPTSSRELRPCEPISSSFCTGQRSSSTTHDNLWSIDADLQGAMPLSPMQCSLSSLPGAISTTWLSMDDDPMTSSETSCLSQAQVDSDPTDTSIYSSGLDALVASWPFLSEPSSSPMSIVPQSSECNTISSTQQPKHHDNFADPFRNSIQFRPVSLLSAALRNALSLRLDFARLLKSDYISPFYQVIKPQDEPKALLASASQPWIPAHLQPTLAQILYPHHPFLDILPYPQLREKVIVMTTLMPHIFNLTDFKYDIYVKNGLVCWGANSNGQPWDMRNWEAAPWFLEKWNMLVDGKEGEIWKQSRRWWDLKARNIEP